MFFAFLVVLLSALITTPVLLYGLGLAARGWRWQHGALFRRAEASGGQGGAEPAVQLLAGPVPVRRPAAASWPFARFPGHAAPCRLPPTLGPSLRPERRPTAHLPSASSPRSAMLASTDALAITAVLRRAGGPESLVTLMEGDSLLNDASGE